MDLVTGALGNLPSKLLELLHNEYKLQKGVRTEVQSLSRELESMHAALRKVAEVPWDQLDEQVKVWAREVREASYDMEDVIDSFLVRVDGCGVPVDESRLKETMKKMGDLFRKGKARHEISAAIQDIKKQLLELAERRARYKVDEILSNAVTTTSAIDPRLAALHKEEKLVGINKPRKDIISMLTSGYKDTVKKVSIVGIGGLGKTTICKASYDWLKSEYDCGAFVSVGRKPDLVRIFKDILFDLDEDKYGNIHNTGRGADRLIREIKRFLANKR
ncbi:unnamed protein product [Urochloa humidicola]